MIISLKGYNLGPSIRTLALTGEAFQRCAGDQMPFFFLKQQRLYFFPEACYLDLPEQTAMRFLQCDDYDVFQINAIGQAYKFYDNESSDNVFMLTSHCNSNCIMCPASDYLRRSGGVASPDEILQIIRQMPSDAKHITITGGEPFLIGESIFEILEALRNKLPDTRFLLLTNGRALSYAPFMERFHDAAPLNTIVGIPLHGYNAETHDRITRSPGGFCQTVHGIRSLLYYGHQVELRIVVSALNAPFLTRIATLVANEMPTVGRVEIMGLEMLGNAALNQDQVWIPYREAFLAAKEAVDILVQNSIEVGIYNFPLCALNREYRHIAQKSITDYKVRFAPECDLCTIKDACGGIFAGSIRLAGKDVSPVIEHDTLL